MRLTGLPESTIFFPWHLIQPCRERPSPTPRSFETSTRSVQTERMIVLEFFTMDLLAATARLLGAPCADLVILSEDKPPSAFIPVIMGALLIVLIVWRKRFRDKR